MKVVKKQQDRKPRPSTATVRGNGEKTMSFSLPPSSPKLKAIMPQADKHRAAVKKCALRYQLRLASTATVEAVPGAGSFALASDFEVTACHDRTGNRNTRRFACGKLRLDIYDQRLALRPEGHTVDIANPAQKSQSMACGVIKALYAPISGKVYGKFNGGHYEVRIVNEQGDDAIVASLADKLAGLPVKFMGHNVGSLVVSLRTPTQIEAGQELLIFDKEVKALVWQPSRDGTYQISRAMYRMEDDDTWMLDAADDLIAAVKKASTTTKVQDYVRLTSQDLVEQQIPTHTVAYRHLHTLWQKTCDKDVPIYGPVGNVDRIVSSAKTTRIVIEHEGEEKTVEVPNFCTVHAVVGPRDPSMPIATWSPSTLDKPFTRLVDERARATLTEALVVAMISEKDGLYYLPAVLVNQRLIRADTLGFVWQDEMMVNGALTFTAVDTYANLIKFDQVHFLPLNVE